MRTDSEVMTTIQAGSREGLAVLFDRHHRNLLGFFLRMTRQRALSEDLVQEVFLRVLRYAGSFRPGSAFKPWMYQIARRVHLDRIGGAAWDELDPEVLPAPGDGPAEQLERLQDLAQLERALDALSAAQRELLLLSRDPDLSYADLAELYGCSPAALKVRVHRALAALRAAFFAGDGHGLR